MYADDFSKHERSRRKVLRDIEVVGSRAAGSSVGHRELATVQEPAVVVANMPNYCTGVAQSWAGLAGFGMESVAVALNRKPIAQGRPTSRDMGVAAVRDSRAVVQP